MAWMAVAIGLVARVALLFVAGQIEPRIADEKHYVELANSVYQGRGFAWADGQATSIRPPLYPTLVAAIWTLAGGYNLLAVRVVQMALALATVWLVYRLGGAMFDERIGALAALGVALYPSLLFANVTLLTETVFTFLLVLTVWWFHVGISRDSVTHVALAGMACGLASLTRSVLWPFPLLGAVVVAAASRGSWRTRTTMAIAFCVCHLLVLAPWAMRNTKLQETVVVVDTIGGFNLWMANSDATPGDRIWAAVSQGGDQHFAGALSEAFPGRRLTEGEKDRWGRSAAFQYIVDHPGVSARRALRKFADFWGLDRELIGGIAQGVYSPPRAAALLIAMAVLLAYPGTMLLASLGVSSPSRRAWATHAMIVAVILFLCGIHTLVFGHSRYRLPIMPFLLIYAAAGLYTGSWRSLRTGWRGTCAGVAMAGLVTIWLQEILVRDADRVRILLRNLGS
jgi:4-amino-4-deoxy-L-arabinose transferase-like glycosyltransferase